MNQSMDSQIQHGALNRAGAVADSAVRPRLKWELISGTESKHFSDLPIFTIYLPLENDMISVLMNLNPIGDPGYEFSCSILKDLGALHLSKLGPRRASRSPCLSTQFITALVGGSLRFWVYKV